MKPFVVFLMTLFTLAALGQAHTLGGGLLGNGEVAEGIAEVAGGLGSIIRAKLKFIEGLLGAGKSKKAGVSVEIGGSHAYASDYGDAEHESVPVPAPTKAPVEKVYLVKVIDKSTTGGHAAVGGGGYGHAISQGVSHGAAHQVPHSAAHHVPHSAAHAAPQVPSYGVSHPAPHAPPAHQVSYSAAHAVPQIPSYGASHAVPYAAPHVASYGASHAAPRVASYSATNAVPHTAPHVANGATYSAPRVANYGGSYSPNYATSHAAPAPAVRYVVRKTVSAPVVSQPVAGYSYAGTGAVGWAKAKK